jgi:hypothetical protein
MRYGAMALGAGAVGWGANWASAHGYKVPDADHIKFYGQLAGGAILMGAAYFMGDAATKKNIQAMVANTIQAAATGVIPALIASRATPDQAKVIELSPAKVADVPPVHS